MVKTAQKQGKLYPAFEGVLCFSQDVPIFELNEEMKWVYHWMNGFADKRDFLVELPKSQVGLLFHSSKVRVTSTVNNYQPHFQISLSLDGEITEWTGNTEQNQRGLKMVTNQAQENMEQLIITTLKEVVNQQGCDVFGLGKTLRKQQSQYYKSLSAWQETMKNSTYCVQVELELTRVGGITTAS